MDNFAILGKSVLDPRSEVICELSCGEAAAIETAEKFHASLGLALTLVLDGSLEIVYRITRRCKCGALQHDFIENVWKCVNCGNVPKSILEISEEEA